MKNDIDKLISPIIKGKRPIYYLITAEELNDLNQNNLFFSIFFTIAFTFIGAIITKGNWDWIYLITAILCLLLAIYFRKLKIDKFIKELRGSGEFRSFSTIEEKSEKLHILEACYGSKPNNIINVTEKLNEKIRNNKLSFKVSNDIAGDPDPGIIKSLDIKYQISDKIIEKTFKENEEVNLP